MQTQTFMLLLMIASAMTTLMTEAVKKLLDDTGTKYYPNILAGIMAVVVSGALSAAYIITAQLQMSGRLWVYVIALVILSWLTAMVGYDKVVQTLAQFKSGGGAQEKTDSWTAMGPDNDLHG